MTLRLHGHPLSSFCMKALVALYEAKTPFEHVQINFGDADSLARFQALWPGMKIPVLEDQARGAVVAESSVIIDYLDAFHPGPFPFTPKDPDVAWRVRMWDRVIDHQLHHPMQKATGDSIRPGGGDAVGVELARQSIRHAYGMLEAQLGRSAGPWLWGDMFTLADCSAAPALFYAHVVEPIGEAHTRLRLYRTRLMQRPSFARALEEAEPWFHLFPYPAKLSRGVD